MEPSDSNVFLVTAGIYTLKSKYNSVKVASLVKWQPYHQFIVKCTGTLSVEGTLSVLFLTLVFRNGDDSCTPFQPQWRHNSLYLCCH